MIQVIVGPRQVGKTTAIKNQLCQGGVYQSADSPTPVSHQLIEAWWQEAEVSSEKVLAIDEVQKIEGWTEVIKKLWDQSKKTNRLKVVLTGSAALSIEKKLNESLAGRFELIHAPSR